MTLQVFKCCVCIWIGVFSETMLAHKGGETMRVKVRSV